MLAIQYIAVVKQICQIASLFCVFDKFMLQQLLRAWTFIRVAMKTLVNKVLEDRRVCGLKSRRFICLYLKYSFKRYKLGIWRFTFGQFYCSDTQRPYIRFLVIITLYYNFRRHPVGRSYKRIFLIYTIRNLCTHSKIRQLNCSIR